MTDGRAVVRAPTWSFFAVGLSYMSLYFQSEADDEKKILGPDEERGGHLCPKCGALFIRGAAAGASE